MRRWRPVLWGLVTVVAVAAVLSLFARPVIAQVRAALVRDVDSPIRGVQHTELVNGNFGSGGFTDTENITPTIPAGKKLFLQSISVHVLLTDSQSLMEARLSLLNPSVFARLYIDMDFQASTTQRHFTGNRDINMMLNAGETMQLFMFRDDNLGSPGLNFYNATIVGYLVDAS